jgi:hypothetical protein
MLRNPETLGFTFLWPRYPGSFKEVEADLGRVWDLQASIQL